MRAMWYSCNAYGKDQYNSLEIYQDILFLQNTFANVCKCLQMIAQLMIGQTNDSVEISGFVNVIAECGAINLRAKQNGEQLNFLNYGDN